MLLSFCVVYLQSSRMQDSRFSLLTCAYHDMDAQDECTALDVMESIHYMCKACSLDKPRDKMVKLSLLTLTT